SGMLVLVAMVDFIEMMRRTSDMKDVSALFVAQVSLYRVPHLTERVLPFTVMTGGMVCYLNLSRRLELVVARSAGISAWQFTWPAVVVALLLGVVTTTIYNPLSSSLREHSARLEAELFRGTRSFHDLGSGFWVRQRTEDGQQSIINAKTSSQQGIQLAGVTVFQFDDYDRFQARIEAKSAELHTGYWRLEEGRLYTPGGEGPPPPPGPPDLKTQPTPPPPRHNHPH